MCVAFISKACHQVSTKFLALTAPGTSSSGLLVPFERESCSALCLKRVCSATPSAAGQANQNRQGKS